jgi:glycosyltransferase involved in cell wall biosynthesis
MKIILFSQQLASFRSGVGAYSLNLLEGLVERGHRLTVVVPRGQPVAAAGVRFIEIPPSRLDLTPGAWLALGIRSARVLRSEARDHDVAHCTDAREGFMLPATGIRRTAMVNDSYALDWLARGYPRDLFSDRKSRASYYAFLRLVESKTYPKYDVVIANSRQVAHRITRGYRLDPARVHVVYCGIPRAKRAVPIRLPGAPAILFVGGNFARKGLPNLLRAIGRVRQNAAEVHLHVVGRDRNQPAIERCAQQLGLADRVTFHDWRANAVVRRMMAGADMLALPSHTEGFGLVYLEAMQAGVPVIASRFSGIREVATPDREAVFVDPGDVAGIAAAIERIHTDAAFAAGLRKGGMKAAARLSIPSMVLQMEAVWESILSRRTR